MANRFDAALAPALQPGPVARIGCAVLAAMLGGRAMVWGESGAVRFEQKTIDQHPPERPYYKMVGDVDGNGQLDIIVGGAREELVWYNHPRWERNTIAAGGWGGVNGEVADIDGDGNIDIVMGSVVWFRNPGVRGRSWMMTRIADEPTHDIEVGDLDLDGRPDVVARHQSAFGEPQGEEIPVFVYFQVAANQWKKTRLPCPRGEGLDIGDLDRDGDIDILVASRWFENTRQGPDGRWPVHRYTERWTEQDAKVEMADMNGDERPDIILTPSELKGETDKVAWYEQPEIPGHRDWPEHIIVSSIECVVHSLAVGDIDNDGDMDVAIAEMHQGTDPDEVTVHYNSERGTKWHKQVLSESGSHDIVMADIGGDGDLDIVGANHAGIHPLQLWENQGLSARVSDPGSPD